VNPGVIPAALDAAVVAANLAGFSEGQKRIFGVVAAGALILFAVWQFSQSNKPTE